jgi:hypothetical protein
MALTENEKKVFLEILERITDSLSNNTCNDFDLVRHMPDKEERRALMREMHEENGDPSEFDPKKDYAIVPDWWVFGFLGKKALEPRAVMPNPPREPNAACATCSAPVDDDGFCRNTGCERGRANERLDSYDL